MLWEVSSRNRPVTNIQIEAGFEGVLLTSNVLMRSRQLQRLEKNCCNDRLKVISPELAAEWDNRRS